MEDLFLGNHVTGTIGEREQDLHDLGLQAMGLPCAL
jgi:hypothetical protein